MLHIFFWTLFQETTQVDNMKLYLIFLSLTPIIFMLDSYSQDYSPWNI